MKNLDHVKMEMEEKMDKHQAALDALEVAKKAIRTMPLISSRELVMDTANQALSAIDAVLEGEK